MELQGLDHVAISVRDVERSAEWYIQVLGLERQHEGRWNGVPIFVGKGETGIALFPSSASGPNERRPEGPRMLHFALRADRENFLAAQRELEARKIPFEFEDHGVSHSIYFRDSDGHKLEITTYELQ